MVNVSYSNLTYMWDAVVNPRIGSAVHVADSYSWGGSFSPTNINQGTDCSGAVSAELSALMRGSRMVWTRQFWTGTFAGVRPGMVGPFANIADTIMLRCVARPTDAPSDAVAIIAIRQLANPEDAHMVIRVQPITGCADIRTGGIDIEMGGQTNDYHTSLTSPRCWSAMNTSNFNQFLYLPGPVLQDTSTSLPVMSAIAAQFGK